MNEIEYKQILKELTELKMLLMLIAKKNNATLKEVGKCVDLKEARISQLLSGHDKKRKESDDTKNIQS
ncbi:MAG: hypothetical protein WBF08_09425 [Candidatus Bathyarchaeia archaeon]